jgi:hypothetical protein
MAARRNRDDELWQKNRWPAPDGKVGESWYDGSMPLMREIVKLSDEKLEQRYLDAIKENRKLGSKSIYFDGDAVYCRFEFDRRLKIEEARADEPQLTKKAIAWCVGEYKNRRLKPNKKTLAREAVDKFLSFLDGKKRENKINSIRNAFTYKLPAHR